jgi:hypothetical protein
MKIILTSIVLFVVAAFLFAFYRLWKKQPLPAPTQVPASGTNSNVTGGEMTAFSKFVKNF